MALPKDCNHGDTIGCYQCVHWTNTRSRKLVKEWFHVDALNPCYKCKTDNLNYRPTPIITPIEGRDPCQVCHSSLSTDASGKPKAIRVWREREVSIDGEGSPTNKCMKCRPLTGGNYKFYDKCQEDSRGNPLPDPKRCVDPINGVCGKTCEDILGEECPPCKECVPLERDGVTCVGGCGPGTFCVQNESFPEGRCFCKYVPYTYEIVEPDSVLINCPQDRPTPRARFVGGDAVSCDCVCDKSQDDCELGEVFVSSICGCVQATPTPTPTDPVATSTPTSTPTPV